MMYNYHPNQPNSDPRGKSGSYNNPYPQTGVQNSMPSYAKESSEKRTNPSYFKDPDPTSMFTAPTKFAGYGVNPDFYNNNLPIDLNYTKPTASTIESQLEHINHLLVHLVEQNNMMLNYLHYSPDQSQTVSTPGGGGSVIVRM